MKKSESVISTEGAGPLPQSPLSRHHNSTVAQSAKSTMWFYKGLCAFFVFTEATVVSSTCLEGAGKRKEGVFS